MKLFESRNVLDRIETTWNIFFSSAWQIRVLPQIIFIAIWTTLGILSFAPLFFFFPDIMTWETIDKTRQILVIIKILMILLVPITLFTLIGGLVYTYTLTVLHDYEVGKTWQQYASIAWSRLWWWLWYGFWVTIFMFVIFGIAVASYFTTSFIFWLGMIILTLVFFWWIVALYAWAPWYILENSWNPRSFLAIFSLTSWRWWNTFGNMLLGSIVVSSMVSLVQQIVNWIMWIGELGTQFISLMWKGNIDWTKILTELSSDYGTRFIIGLILFFILSGGQQVFIGMFQYIVWKEITTDAPEASKKIVE